jgi:2,4-dienoyl-CoA reductase-like NADH-dependent reductase (Old Yellow Enzyme family)
LAEAIKPITNIPVLVTGGITEIGMAEDLIRTGTADLVGIGRALLADPQWVAKAWQRLLGPE